MSSGSVKDSARGMMAQLAERRDDLAGVLTTSSSATAFTVATNQFFASLADRRQGIDDRAAPTSGASPSLAVDGLAARPTGSRPARPVPAGGLLLSGHALSVSYYNAAAQFIVQGALGALPFWPRDRRGAGGRCRRLGEDRQCQRHRSQARRERELSAIL